MKNRYQVIVRTLPQDAPRDFEMSAALILASYLKTDVIFLRPGQLKSPDLLVKNEVWELKSPRGNGKNTIHNIIKGARKQSTNIVIDLRFCKMNEQNAKARIRHTYNKRKRKTGKYLIVDRDGKIVDISDIL